MTHIISFIEGLHFIVFNKPNKPSFTKAVFWCWGKVQTDIFFHLEDDWCLKSLVNKNLSLKPFLKENIEKFDVITGIDIIEHFSKDELMEVLNAVRNSLKANGIAIFRTPNLDAPFATLFANGDFTHENYLNYSSANQVLLTAGFSEIQVFDSLMRSDNFLKEICRKIIWSVVKFFIKLVVFASARSTRAMVFSPNLLIKAKKITAK